MSKKRHLDPDARRYYDQFPKFPGMAKCVELLRDRNTKGTYLETIEGEIQIHAKEHLDELIAIIRNDDSHIGAWLLEALAEAKVPEAEEFLIENLQSAAPHRRFWAIYGLKNLDTKSARKALWDARSYTFDTREATEEFRRTINEAMGWKD
jgi:hypothetical protein